MAKTLVIVESPAKAKTIKKYLGQGYDVVASKGHVKDLPKKQNAVDVANDFTETYEVIEGKEKVLAELKAAAKKVDAVLLATDPDREGEAIAWHISEEIRDPKLKVSRVEFHEITKKGIEAGVDHPRDLDENLYDAQRARRVLDRIVGYDVSALVWSKLAFGCRRGAFSRWRSGSSSTASARSTRSSPRSTGTWAWASRRRRAARSWPSSRRRAARRSR
jgi:DNA topoisomerase-1